MMVSTDHERTSLKMYQRRRLRRQKRAQGPDNIANKVAQTLAIILAVVFITNIQFMMFKLELANYKSLQVSDTLGQSTSLTNRRSKYSNGRRLLDMQSSVEEVVPFLNTDKYDTDDIEAGAELRDEQNETDPETRETVETLPPRTMLSTKNPIYFMHIGKVSVPYLNLLVI